MLSLISPGRLVWSFLVGAFLFGVPASGAQRSRPSRPPSKARKKLASGPFTDVSRRTAYYRWLTSMEERGYPTGFSKGAFRRAKPLTRYEFAVATLRLCNAFGVEQQTHPPLCADCIGECQPLADIRPLGTTGKARVHERAQRYREVVTLRRLTRAFASELRQLGIDTSALQGRLNQLAYRVRRGEEQRT